jgi:tetratricopeptide (TPR) repeat protein
MNDTITIRGADGNEFAYQREHVLASLLQLLQVNRVDEAADLYARIREDISFPLIARAQAQKDTFRQVANLFFRARDFARAAYCCEHLDEPKKAASLYEQAGDFVAAAQMFATAGDVPRSAEMFERAGSLVEAARMYVNVGTPEALLRAAACFERAARLFDAAQCYERAGRPEQAIALYRSIDDESPDKKVAQKLARALADRLSPSTSPSGALPAAGPTTSRFGTGAPAPTASDPTASDTAQHARSEAYTAEASAVPMTPPDPSSPAAGPGASLASAVVDTPETPAVSIMEGFDGLKSLPLFSPLTLPELKAVYHLCTIVALGPQELLIAAGAPASAVWIVLEGELAVSTRSGAEVARVGAGGHVGEMGLFDDAPASVDVAVSVPGRALRLHRSGLREMVAANDSLAARIYRVLFATLRDRLRATTDKMAASA